MERPRSSNRWRPCSPERREGHAVAEQERLDLDVGGPNYETNYDGSQDEEDRSNDAVLDAFLKPFEGDEMARLRRSRGPAHRHQRGSAAGLPRAWPTRACLRRPPALRERRLAGGSPPEGALLVNLNLRAVTAGGASSLVEQQLMQLLQPALWAPCEGARCAHRVRCFTTPTLCAIRTPVQRCGNACVACSKWSTCVVAHTSRCETCAPRSRGSCFGTTDAPT